MANEKISAMTSVTNSGTLQVPVVDPNDLTSNKKTTLPALSMHDGSAHTITNMTTLVIGSGGTVSGSAGVGTLTGFGGGGGGSYTAGLGISIDSGTINNTGSIVLPSLVGAGTPNGVALVAQGQTVSSGDAASGGAFIYGGDAVVNSGTGNAYSQGMFLRAGNAYAQAGGNAATLPTGIGGARAGIGTSIGQGAYIYLGRTGVGPGYGYGGNGIITGGTIAGVGSVGRAGYTKIAGGMDVENTGTGGNLILETGTGATNGVLLVKNIPTTDPHILNAKFQQSISGVGWVGVYSQG